VLFIASFDGPLYKDENKVSRREKMDKIELGKQLGFVKDSKFIRKLSQKSEISINRSNEASFESLPLRVPIQWMNEI